MSDHARSNVSFRLMILWTKTCQDLVISNCVFYTTADQIYWRFGMHDMVSAGFCFLISHTDNTQGTQGPMDCHTYKYILTPPECTHSSFLYYTEWIICCWHKKYFTEVHKIFAFQILINCAGDGTTKCKGITNSQLFLMAFYKELLLCMKITRHDLMTC